MEHMEKLLGSMLSADCRPTSNDLQKASAILIRIAEAIAYLIFKEAVASLAVIGVMPSQFTYPGFMGFASKLQMEKLSALGLLRRDKLVLRHTAKAKKYLKQNPHVTNGNDLLSVAYFHDVVAYLMRHFLPTAKLAALMARPGMVEQLPDDEYTMPAPYSEDAAKCLDSFATASFPTIKTRPTALEPVELDEVLKEIYLTVDEAARIIRVAPKTLEDMCRDGRIPSTMYIRFAKTGNYHFITSKLRAFLENRGLRN